jgi:hypothetical protein
VDLQSPQNTILMNTGEPQNSLPACINKCKQKHYKGIKIEVHKLEFNEVPTSY